MKVWTLAVVSVVAGAVAGAGNVWLELVAVDAPFQSTAIVSEDGWTKGPRAVVAQAEYDFGVGQRDSKMTHTFVIRNEGDQSLMLEAGETTCKCTISNLENGYISPGEEAEVNIDWKLTAVGSEFRQSAEIRTNDVTKPVVTLSVYGRIVDRVKLDPRDIVLTSVSASSGATAQFHLFAYGDEKPVEVTSYEFRDEDSRPYFDLSFERAGAESLAEEQGATSGLVGTVLVKPGLPLGPINQTIRMTTNVSAVGDLELAVTGSAVSDISIVGGSDFRQNSSRLDLGTIDVGVGAQRDLRVLIKGPHRQDTQFAVKQVDPEDVLEVSLGDAQSINDGAVYMRKLSIRVREDARPINRLGAGESEYGKIVIETTHPDAKIIPIYVKFSVR
jgi:hypothetical protein